MMTTNQKTFQFANIFSLILSGLMSFLLCSTGVFSILSPLPLISSGLRHGTLSITIIGLLTIAGVAFGLSAPEGKWAITLMLSVYVLISLIITYTVNTGLKPMKSLVLGGSVVLMLISILSFGYLESRNQTANEYLTEKITENKKIYTAFISMAYEKESIEYKAITDKIEKEPESFAKEIIPAIPKVVIVVVFITFWINMCLAFRTRFIDPIKRAQIKDLIHVRVPDHFVWVFIVGLALVVFGDSLGGIYTEVGSYVLTILSIFYFFQGFGVYVAFLDSLKVVGFFRSLLVVSTVYLAFQVLIIIGFSDLFVNYRRFFKKKSNEGDL